MLKVYLDVCCLNRPFDDQTQDRIHLEAEAVLLILSRLEAGLWQWVSSEAVDFAVEQTPDIERRRRVKLLTTAAHHLVTVEEPAVARAQELEALGFRALDALHLACAESGGAEVLLTTDDRLLRQAQRFSAQLHIKVENPLEWLKEIVADERTDFNA